MPVSPGSYSPESPSGCPPANKRDSGASCSSSSTPISTARPHGPPTVLRKRNSPFIGGAVNDPDSPRPNTLPGLHGIRTSNPLARPFLRAHSARPVRLPQHPSCLVAPKFTSQGPGGPVVPLTAILLRLDAFEAHLKLETGVSARSSCSLR